MNLPDLKSAYKYLLGQPSTRTQYQKSAPVDEPEIPLQDLIRRNTTRVQGLMKFTFDKGLPYVTNRGIDAEQAFWRGYAVDNRYENATWIKIKKTGEWVKLDVPRYIIPRQVNKKIYSVNSRRDEPAILEYYETIQNTELLDKVYLEKGELDQEGFLALFPKYKRWKMYGHRLAGIYNINRLMEWVGDQWNPKPLSYITIHESEYTVAVLESWGIPAIQAEDYRRLNLAISKVDYVHLFIDNDGGPGDQIADQMLEYLTHPSIYRHKTPNHKTIDEWLQVDPQAAFTWLRSCGIIPLPKMYINKTLQNYCIY